MADPESSRHTIEHFFSLNEMPYIVATYAYCPFLVMVSAVIAASRALCPQCHKARRNRRKGCWINCHNKICDTITSFSSWLVKTLFLQSEAFSKSRNEDGKKSKGIFINGKRMDNTDINILGVIIFCLSLLIGIAAYDIYLLEISHICSDDQAIHCFVDHSDLRDAANPNTSGPTQFFPVSNCSYWTDDPDIASKITFVCYVYTFNATDAMVATGAMLALFVIAMRIIVSIILSAVGALHKRGCNKCLTVVQVVAAITLLATDNGIAMSVLASRLADNLSASLDKSDEFPIAREAVVYISEHGIQLLTIFGTATLLLLVNWKRYVQVDKADLRERRETVV